MAQEAGVKAPPEEPKPFVFDFRTEVPVTTLINYVRDQLNLPLIYADSGLKDQIVVFTAPLTVPQDKALQFLNMVLQPKNYTIVRNELGIYIVQPITNLAGNGISGNDPFSTTQVMVTPGIKPSAMSAAIQGLGAGGMGTVVPLDDLGVLLVTDTPQRTRQIRDLIDRLVLERAAVKVLRLEIKYIAANTARERVLMLLGESGAAPPPSFQQPPAQRLVPDKGGGQGGATFAGSGATMWQARLTVDPQSNALFFQGREDEAKYIRDLLEIVDVPNTLTSVFYPVGNKAAEAVSAAGVRLGLGDVTRYQSQETGGTQRGGAGVAQPPIPGNQFQQQQQQQGGGAPGSGFVIYTDAGGFMYHGTASQHAEVADLVKGLSALTINEAVTYEFYKLKHAKATDVAEIVQNLLQNQMPTGNTGPLLGGLTNQPGGRNQRNPRDRTNPQDRTRNPQDRTRNSSESTGRGPTGGAIQGTGSGLNEIDAADSFVLADEKNNQIVVKTVGRLQPQFEKLIRKLDLRRPQVYVSAKIVAITATEDFRLAFETQLINANGTGGVVNTNFGLRGGSATSSILTPLAVGTGLPGLTAAVIKSDQVPIVITALQNNVNTRILATPQLLIDDNENAEVSSESVIPTQVSSQSNSTTITSVGDPARAGTTLNVTPQISEESVKLTYEVIQSNFTGSAAAPGLPPPSFENRINSEVTVPPESTIVVGGLTLTSTEDTVMKVPLLGDIPLVGLLFRDTKTRDQKTTLYVFITPTIMRDPNFADLRLLTKGPMNESHVYPDDNLPSPEPVKMELLEPVGSGVPGPGTVERRP